MYKTSCNLILTSFFEKFTKPSHLSFVAGVAFFSTIFCLHPLYLPLFLEWCTSSHRFTIGIDVQTQKMSETGLYVVYFGSVHMFTTVYTLPWLMNESLSSLFSGLWSYHSITCCGSNSQPVIIVPKSNPSHFPFYFCFVAVVVLVTCP